MTQMQRVIKYVALAFAALLIVGIVSGIVQVVMFFVGEEELSEDPITMKLSEEVHSLNIELKNTALIVTTGDDLRFETNNPYLSFDSENGRVSVEEEYRPTFGVGEKAYLTLTVPTDKSFKDIEIKAGAGRVDIETLSAEKVEFDFGAGEVTIDELYVTETTDIDGGAGSIEIASGSLSDLDLDMGVGELDLCSALVGRNEISCGVGSVKVTLLGPDSDYAVSVSKGLGTVQVGGKDVHDGETIGNGANQIHVSGGVGEILVLFESK